MIEILLYKTKSYDLVKNILQFVPNSCNSMKYLIEMTDYFLDYCEKHDNFYKKINEMRENFLRIQGDLNFIFSNGNINYINEVRENFLKTQDKIDKCITKYERIEEKMYKKIILYGKLFKSMQINK